MQLLDGIEDNIDVIRYILIANDPYLDEMLDLLYLLKETSVIFKDNFKDVFNKLIKNKHLIYDLKKVIFLFEEKCNALLDSGFIDILLAANENMESLANFLVFIHQNDIDSLYDFELEEANLLIEKINISDQSKKLFFSQLRNFFFKTLINTGNLVSARLYKVVNQQTLGVH